MQMVAGLTPSSMVRGFIVVLFVVFFVVIVVIVVVVVVLVFVVSSCFYDNNILLKLLLNNAGFIPDDHALRGRCFKLMTLISALHNFSRSVGCALLVASSGKSMLVYFVGGEILLFLAWKFLRGDILYWVRVEGVFGVVVSFVVRVIVKVVADFTGCLLLRHPYELGGAIFSASVLWVSVGFNPFVSI